MTVLHVTASTVSVEERAQKDGRFWVTESHTLDDGSVQSFSYLCDPQIDYQAVMAERAAQINAQLAADAVAVPQSITAVQARRAVNAAGLRSAVEQAVAGASEEVQALWYTADTIERKNQALLQMAAAIGLNADQVDDLFRAGARL